METCFFSSGLFEHAKKVKIENLNEYAFRFYNILTRSGMPVEVYGEAWTILFPGLCGIEQNVPENNILKIYADGVSRIGLSTAQNIHNQWSFIEEIGWTMHHEITEKYRKKFEEKGVMCLTAYFPNRPGSYNTVEELYREKNWYSASKAWMEWTTVSRADRTCIWRENRRRGMEKT